MADAHHFQASVELPKITEYLLSESTEKSRSRSGFLRRFGFQSEFPEVLRTSLLQHPRDGEIVSRGRSTFGEHCNVVGALRSPDGRNPTITTCWTKRQGEDVWRFTTLLPR